jgi:hypothetical protein
MNTTQPTRAERRERGKAARTKAPREAHRELNPSAHRDPLGLLLGQAATRVPELVPIRHGRMLVSPFTFFRGAALPMAADLATMPTSGLQVQLCGDAHLSNFGAFASPERRLVFDINDFDETLPGPFEWDVKRLSASLQVAGRDNGFSAQECRDVVLAGVRGYRTAIRSLAHMSTLDVWYSHLDADKAVKQLASQLPKKGLRRLRQQLAKAGTRDSMQALAKLTTTVDGRSRIISDPPLIVPVDELFSDLDAQAMRDMLLGLLDKYVRTLQSDRRHLIRQFDLSTLRGRLSGSAASERGRGFCCWRRATGGSRCSFKPRRRSRPSSSRTPPAAGTPTRVNEWWPGSTSCRPAVTSSSAGSGRPAWTGSTATCT